MSSNVKRLEPAQNGQLTIAVTVVSHVSSATTTYYGRENPSAFQIMNDKYCQKYVDSVQERKNPIMLTLLQDIQGLRRKFVDISRKPPPTKVLVIPSKPFGTLEAFLSFEMSLKENSHKFYMLKCDLKNLSKLRSKRFVKISWQHIITTGVARKLSWYGSLNRKKVKDFCVASAIYQVFVHEMEGTINDYINASISFFR